MIKRAVLYLMLMSLCATGVLAQAKRQKTAMSPGYYFTIGMCTACVYPDWHAFAIKLFRAKGIRAIQGRGYETQTSNQPFAPLNAFEMRFDSNVDRDSQILAQIYLYVGPFASESAAKSALSQFPSILHSIIANGGLADFKVRRGTQVTRTSGNQYSFGDSSPFFISGYKLLPKENARSTASSNDWNSFWNGFRDAVRRRNRAALKGMMIRDFEWSFGLYPPGDHRDTLFRSLDRYHNWTTLDRVLAQGTVAPSENGEELRTARLAPDFGSWRAGFKRGSDGRWRWIFFLSGD